MSRRVYVYDPVTKTMVPKGENNDAVRGTIIMGDLPDFVSPVDGRIVNGRAGLRQHDKELGVTNVADYKETWAKKRRERERFYAEGPSGVKDAVIRAFNTLEQRRR